MYSVVLATMLAAGTTTPGWHTHARVAYAPSCYSCSCYSSGHGCYAGYVRHHSIFHHWHCSCHSCYSGYSCYSSCSSCYSGCYSSCYSSCSGCCSYYVPYSCSCTCSTVVTYGCTGCCGGVVVPSTPRVVPVPSSSSEVESLRKELQELKEKLKKTEKVSTPSEQAVTTPASARVTVTLPTDARLWIENVECPLTSNVRSFSTPTLNPNQQYFYNMTMQVERNGQTLRETQRVLIVPGQAVNVSFNGENLIAAR